MRSRRTSRYGQTDYGWSCSEVTQRSGPLGICPVGHLGGLNRAGRLQLAVEGGLVANPIIEEDRNEGFRSHFTVYSAVVWEVDVLRDEGRRDTRGRGGDEDNQRDGNVSEIHVQCSRAPQLVSSLSVAVAVVRMVRGVG